MSRRNLLRLGAAGAGGLALSQTAVGVASAATSCEPRYLGYRYEDYRLPYSKYFTPRTDPAQPQVPMAISAGPLPESVVPSQEETVEILNAPGKAAVETGYGLTGSGEVFVACLTRMPDVEPRMWDWWFGWHSDRSAKYKLWHPEAHQYAGIKRNLVERDDLADRQKYIGNVSYVDETIGTDLNQLAISFVEPSTFGVDLGRFDGTAICARVGTPLAPVNIGKLVHQVRRVPGGSEMRSRFYLNVPGFKGVDLDALGCALRRGIVLPSNIVFPVEFGAKLLEHCGREMNHLAARLPALYREFGR